MRPQWQDSRACPARTAASIAPNAWSADRYVQLGDDLREARFQAGLSQRELGATIGLSHSAVSRIERGEARDVPYRTLVRVAGQLGMDIPLRAYPRGDPIRDQAQLEVLRRLRSRLPPGLGWRLEVALGHPG